MVHLPGNPFRCAARRGWDGTVELLKPVPTAAAGEAALERFAGFAEAWGGKHPAIVRLLRYQCRDAAPQIRVIDAVLPLVDTDMTRGRGRGKLSAAQAADAVIDGIRRDRAEIYVGRTKLLRTAMRLSPSLGHRILRHG